MVVEAASEWEVNEGICHETLTERPIMRVVSGAEYGEETERKKSLYINEMGHRMNVECALSTLRKRKMTLICMLSLPETSFRGNR